MCVSPGEPNFMSAEVVSAKAALECLATIARTNSLVAGAITQEQAQSLQALATSLDTVPHQQYFPEDSAPGSTSESEVTMPTISQSRNELNSLEAKWSKAVNSVERLAARVGWLGAELDRAKADLTAGIKHKVSVGDSLHLLSTKLEAAVCKEAEGSRSAQESGSEASSESSESDSKPGKPKVSKKKKSSKGPSPEAKQGQDKTIEGRCFRKFRSSLKYLVKSNMSGEQGEQRVVKINLTDQSVLQGLVEDLVSEYASLNKASVVVVPDYFTPTTPPRAKSWS